jgi:GntR family transcriptional regulator
MWNTDSRSLTESVGDLVFFRPAVQNGSALERTKFSLRLLARELRISVITTKRAYEELEREGFLETVPGKGCFVAPQDRELLREAQLRKVEEKLAQAVDEARKGAVSLAELQEMLNLLYQGE